MHATSITSLQLIEQAINTSFPLFLLIGPFQDRVIGQFVMEEELFGQASYLGLVPTLLIHLEQEDTPVNGAVGPIG